MKFKHLENTSIDKRIITDMSDYRSNYYEEVSTSLNGKLYHDLQQNVPLVNPKVNEQPLVPENSSPLELCVSGIVTFGRGCVIAFNNFRKTWIYEKLKELVASMSWYYLQKALRVWVLLVLFDVCDILKRGNITLHIGNVVHAIVPYSSKCSCPSAKLKYALSWPIHLFSMFSNPTSTINGRQISLLM